MKFKICIWMNLRSHWQIAFFEALMVRNDIDLQVRYFGRVDNKRMTEGWPGERRLMPYEKLVGNEEDPETLMNDLDDGPERIHIVSLNCKPELVEYFCKKGMQWCYWGEMPSYRLEHFLGNRTTLPYRFFRSAMLSLKRGEGRKIGHKALGAFSQGVLAENAFVAMGVKRENISGLFFSPNPLPHVEPARALVEFAHGRTVFLSVGALCRRKGTDMLLKAFSRLKGSGCCLVLCGVDDSKGAFARLANKLGVADRVLFLGAYSVECLAEVYSAGDVFVQASRFDGWGGVLNEAASLGLPLISTDLCGAAHHLIKSGGNGFRVRSGSTHELVQAMEYYLDHLAAIQRQGEFSRALYFREFTPEKNGDRLVSALKAWQESAPVSQPVKRVIIQQPALPKYRVPFFLELSAHPATKVKLLYSSVDPSLANEPAVGLDAEFVPMKLIKMKYATFMWHSAQWHGAKRGACDVLVLSWNVQYISLVPALLRARFNGTRTVLWGHGYSKNESLFRKKIRDVVGRMADALLFYDFSTADAFIQAGWHENKIYVVPNSLNQTLIQQEQKNWMEHPAQLKRFQQENQLSGKKNIIFIGRIYEDNRLDLLVRALPAIVQKHPEMQLLVIGNVNSVAMDLQRLARELGVDGAIRWLGAIYDEREIAPYMLSSSLFCYPANIGLSIMHAMGYGVPVITGDHRPSHNPEIHVLKDGFNGLLFKHLSVSDLALKIVEALDQPGELRSLGRAARDSILESFTIEKMADGFVQAMDISGNKGQDTVMPFPERSARRKICVSVVVPTYKRLDLLKRAVESVFAQSHEDWELIISDNEKPAGATWDYLQDLARTSPKITVLQNSGCGLVSNFNNALNHAQGEWVKPLFDDDVLMPDCLEIFLQAVSGHSSVVLAGCLAWRVRPDKAERMDRQPVRKTVEIVEQRYAHLAMYLQDYECGGVPSQMMVRRSAIDAGAVMPDPVSIKGALDSYWYADILQHGDRLHLALPLIKEYQGTHETLTSTLGEDIPTEELILYRHHIYDSIPPALKPPSVAIIEQMIYGIRGLHMVFIGQNMRGAMKRLSKIRHPRAWWLVFKWALRRTMPGRFTATPRLRYAFRPSALGQG